MALRRTSRTMSHNVEQVPRIRNSGWLPQTLRRRYLIPLACLMAAMLIVTEVLRQWGSNTGGLVVFTSSDEITVARRFMFTYAPSILGMIVAILWSVVEYDALRLEPYFQLSKPQGVSAEVLLLNYEFGHFTTAPFFAFRNRHWMAVFISVLSVLLQLVFPTLQSSLFRMNGATISNSQHLEIWPDLINMEGQASVSYNSTVHHTAHRDHRYLTYDEPDSGKYAMAPVNIPWDVQYDTTMWELTQSVYWAELSCTDLEVKDDVTTNVVSNVSRSEAASLFDHSAIWDMNISPASERCSMHLSEAISIPSTNESLEITHWQPILSTTGLNDRCTAIDIIGVIVTISPNQTSQNVSSNGSIPQDSNYIHNVSGFGCQILYRTSEASISLQVNGSLFVTALNSASISNVSDVSLNTTHFKNLILSEVLANNGTTFWSKKPLGESASQRGLISTLNGSVQEAFVPLMNRIFDVSAQSNYVKASHVTRQMAIMVGPWQSLISEAILVLSVLVILYLAYAYPRRPNLLRGDPASIASMCGIMADIIDITHISHLNLDQLSTRQLRSILRNYNCRWQQDREPPCIRIEPSHVHRSMGQSARTRSDPKPHFLLIPIFGLEFLIFAAAVAGLATVIALCVKDGYVQPLTFISSSSIAVLFSLVPSSIASIIRAICLSIYRYLSVLEPWSVLQMGGASAASSLLLEYGSLNPFASLFNWFNYNHILLGLVGVACIVNTGLSILVNGLFQHDLGPTTVDTDMKTWYSYDTFTIRQPSSVLPELDAMRTSIYSGSSILPWTSSSLSFLPAWTDNSSDWLVGGTLLGVGADIFCREISVTDSYTQDPGSSVSHWKYSPFNESSTTCEINAIRTATGIENPGMTVNFFASTPYGASEGCQKPAILVVAQPSGSDHNQITSANTVAMICESSIVMQNFSVAFNSQGFIQNHVPLNDTTIVNGPMLQNGTSNLNIYNHRLSSAVLSNGTVQAPNASTQVDYFGSLTVSLYELMNSNTSYIAVDVLTRASRSVYRSMFATDLSLERDAYFRYLETPAHIKDGIIYHMSWAVVPTLLSFISVMLIVVFDACIVASVFITRRYRFRFPRIPRSIGSIMPWITQSQILNDFKGTYAWSDDERRKHFADLDKKYKLDRLETPDGKWKYILDEDRTVSRDDDSVIDEGTKPKDNSRIRLRALFRRTNSEATGEDQSG
ncbi:DUF3433 domain-containing protein [Aspergillus saccharolyticus JOP 1030-1]|uniref:Uncharacterized protein n=1 Tax=Aspergillus saccharolyticus JOP 1030-1 TaxID=1450539 RepID=A0A318ZMH4_9EURO|nr:hypothetical protein BP01DRAFT_311408 [Aspergillus saccharolyticus JOP 1030-1]PYH48821.1 hypothetical protein BP01DRAFT_311408 [Aspergillus saccharolyticus JOP 1030-1]